MSSFFDDIDQQRPDLTNIDPFHSVQEQPEHKVLEWLSTVVEALREQSIQRTTTQRMHLSTYRGAAFSSKSSNSRSSEREYRSTKINKFIVNHLYDLTESKVAQLNRLKPAVEVMPTNDEFEDKNAAKATKMLINHVWYLNDLDSTLQKLHRHALILGESYLFITWNKDKGDLHPDYAAAQQDAEELDMVDDNGEPLVRDGEAMKIKDPVHIGDVEYKIELPWRVLLQRKEDFDDVEYAFRVTIEDMESVRKEYPKAAGKIKSDRDIKTWEPDSLQDKVMENSVIVYEFYHKRTKFVPKGYFAKFTPDAILESSELPYTHGELPFERLTDLDMPSNLNGVSRYTIVGQIQRMHDNLSTLLAKNIYLCGHAKWMLPKGAAKIESLGNDNTVVKYQGPIPPQLVQSNPNPPEAYSFRDQLRIEMETIFGVSGVSRGQPPAGVTAGVALQFLNEQENERATADISKHNILIQKIAKKTIAVCGDYYLPDDGRMLRIVGKDNKYMIRYFDAANLSKDYDIRVQNSSALPESKAARIQKIIEMMQYKPDLLTPERWVDLLELGNIEKFASLVTEAVKTADSENEDILSGKLVGEPEVWEDHIAHWRSHVKAIQSRSFKEETPVEVKDNMQQHIMVTEYAMMEKMKEHPLFQAKLAQLELFPLFYKGAIPQSREQQTAMVQGQANRGELVTGSIPAEEAGSYPGESTNINTTGTKERK